MSLLVWDSAGASCGVSVRGLRTEGGYTRRQDKGGKDGSRRRQGVISPVSYGLTWETHLTGTQVLSYMQRHSRRGITLQRARANDPRGIRLEERE